VNLLFSVFSGIFVLTSSVNFFYYQMDLNYFSAENAELNTRFEPILRNLILIGICIVLSILSLNALELYFSEYDIRNNFKYVLMFLILSQFLYFPNIVATILNMKLLITISNILAYALAFCFYLVFKDVYGVLLFYSLYILILTYFFRAKLGRDLRNIKAYQLSLVFVIIAYIIMAYVL